MFPPHLPSTRPTVAGSTILSNQETTKLVTSPEDRMAEYQAFLKNRLPPPCPASTPTVQKTTSLGSVQPTSRQTSDFPQAGDPRSSFERMCANLEGQGAEYDTFMKNQNTEFPIAPSMTDLLAFALQRAQRAAEEKRTSDEVARTSTRTPLQLRTDAGSTTKGAPPAKGFSRDENYQRIKQRRKGQ